jgi:hypothetical protein
MVGGTIDAHYKLMTVCCAADSSFSRRRLSLLACRRRGDEMIKALPLWLLFGPDSASHITTWSERWAFELNRFDYVSDVKVACIFESGDSPVSVKPSRDVCPDYPENKPSRKHVYAMQARASLLPNYCVEGREHDNHSDPVSGKCAHPTISSVAR